MLKQLLVSTAMAALSLAGQSIDRTKAPETPPIPDYKLPPTYESKLPNGMAVVFVQDDRFPLVTARINFQAGSTFGPAIGGGRIVFGLGEQSGNIWLAEPAR